MVQRVQELTSTNYVPSPVPFIFQTMALGILFCLYLLTVFFLFHSEELRRENISEIDTLLGCMHSLKLGCITDISGEYAFSCRATHILFFKYSGTKILYWTQFIRNTISFPVFHVIGFLYCLNLKKKIGSSFETSGTFNPTIQRHTSGYLNLYLFQLSDRGIGISVSFCWRYDRTMAACGVCTLKCVSFSKLFSCASFE